jgi:hypothetical protein
MPRPPVTPNSVRYQHHCVGMLFGSRGGRDTSASCRSRQNESGCSAIAAKPPLISRAGPLRPLAATACSTSPTHAVRDPARRRVRSGCAIPAVFAPGRLFRFTAATLGRLSDGQTTPDGIRLALMKMGRPDRAVVRPDPSDRTGERSWASQCCADRNSATGMRT